MTSAIPASERIDKFLWHARFFRTRTLASRMIKTKKVKLNGLRVVKASALVTVGDILTVTREKETITLEIKALGTKRGSAPEAQTLYLDLTPDPIMLDPLDPRYVKAPTRERGMGRPTKADRRAMDKLRERD